MLGPGPKRRRRGAWSGGYIVFSVVIGAAHIVAALLAKELALPPGEPFGADRAVQHGLIFLFPNSRLFRFVHDDLDYNRRTIP
jgi:hypothetical protein